jgi:hypothetical protein
VTATSLKNWSPVWQSVNQIKQLGKLIFSLLQLVAYQGNRNKLPLFSGLH